MTRKIIQIFHCAANSCIAEVSQKDKDYCAWIWTKGKWVLMCSSPSPKHTRPIAAISPYESHMKALASVLHVFPPRTATLRANTYREMSLKVFTAHKRPTPPPMTAAPIKIVCKFFAAHRAPSTTPSTSPISFVIKSSGIKPSSTHFFLPRPPM